MPAKSGASHALAAFLSIVLGSVLSNVLSAHTTVIRDVSRSTGGVISAVPGMSLPDTVTGFLLVAIVISFLWGIAYHFARHGTDSDRNRPNDFVSDSQSQRHMSGPGPAAGTSVRQRLPAELDGIVSTGYGTCSELLRADDQVTRHVERTLSACQTSLDTAHDAFLEADSREVAEEVAELRETVEGLARKMDQPVPERRSLAETQRNADILRQPITSVHCELIEATTNLSEGVDAVVDAARGDNLDSDLLEACEQRASELREIIGDREETFARATENS